MKYSLLVGICLCVLSGCNSTRIPTGTINDPSLRRDLSTAGQPVYNWRLETEVKDQSGADFEVTARLINDDEKTRDAGEYLSGALGNWHFVVEKDGKRLPPSLFFKNSQRKISSGTSVFSLSELKKGEFINFSLDVKRLFDFSEDGQYKVYVKKIMIDVNQGDRWITAAPLIINITHAPFAEWEKE